jgi:hypothetical protein
MSRHDDYSDDSGNFERFKKRPKNPQKGKQNRSNEKQMIRDHFVNNNNDELDDFNDDFMEKWERS